MADVKSKLILDIETNARQAQGELSSMARAAASAETQRNAAVQQRVSMLDKEQQLAMRMNAYLDQRKQKEQQLVQESQRALTAYRQQTEELRKQNALAARIPLKDKWARMRAEAGAGGGLAGQIGRMGGGAFLGSQVAGLAGDVFSGNTSNIGQNVGNVAGAGLGMASTMLVGPVIAAAVTPVLTNVLGSIGALFDKENAKRDAAEAAKTQKEAAELQRKAAEEQMRAAKQANLDKYMASLEKLLAGTQDAARRTAIEQEIKHVEASGEIPEGGWRKYAIDMEKERQEFLQFVKDMNALVKAGVLSKGDAQRRIEGAKPPSDVLATGSVSTYETYLGVD